MWNGKHPEQKGNTFPFATIGCYQASDVPLMIAASNIIQQCRLWTALGREDMIKTDNNQRLDAHAEETEVLRKIIGTMTADYWEDFLQKRRIPAARIRRMEEALSDSQVASRPVLHQHDAPDSKVDGLTVPVAAFSLSDSPCEINLPPQLVGAQTTEILAELGYGSEEIETMRSAGAIN
jgi:crotonobetainyl-CoA:carnitine CoA-transferase CaiB-like acyl-CoA transferase